jgi:hypothetical protein
MTTREWCGLILETRTEYGSASRRHGGWYVGTTIHRLRCEYVIGIVPGNEYRPDRYRAMFLKSGKPVLFNASPVCDCTHRGHPTRGTTADQVTCDTCTKLTII